MTAGQLGRKAGQVGWKILYRIWRILRWLWSSLPHPVVGAVEAVLVIGTGLVGSVVTDDLRVWTRGLIRWWHSQGPFPHSSDGVRFFWICILTILVLHVVRTVAQQVHQQKTEKKFEIAAAKIEDLVATNASPDYLAELGLSFEKSDSLCKAANSSEQRRQAFHYVLQAIARLASVYDSPRDPATSPTFVANVMWYLPREKAEPWDSYVAFRASGTTLSGVRGVLAMPKSFSVATSKTDGQHELPDFALDVPVETGTAETGWSVLPGAPFCFVRKHFEHFHPSKDIEEWMTKNGDFAPSVAKAVGSYFRDNPAIAGFMSLPLFVPTTDYQEPHVRDVIGILNVHWSVADILSHYKAARKFGDTIYPLRVLLSQLMLRLLEDDGPPIPA